MKKEPWMKKGNAVLALDVPGVIIKVIENEGLGEVFQMDIRPNGQNNSMRYHITDVKKIK